MELLDGIRKGTHQAKDVYKRIILDPEVIEVAYLKISKNKGAMTAGIDGKTLDGMSRKQLNQILLELKNHSFNFKPVRREYIPKANGKRRPLGIPCSRDKIVQQSMVMILEAVFEKDFLKSNNGFRPGKGCHTALKQISRWIAIDWFIEGDIKSYFDTIDHHILKHLIYDKIADQQFIELYWKAVRAGYVEFKGGKKMDVSIGTPQGSIISPVLSNIYLHQLDLYMEKLIQNSLVSGKTSKSFKPYKKLDSRIQTLYKRISRNKLLDNTEHKLELKQRIKQRSLLPSTIPAEGYRIYYVRYADDFIVGINGKLKLASEIKQNIGIFLEKELKLTMSEQKTKLTHSKQKILYLGTEIYRRYSRTNNQNSIMKYNPITKRRHRSRTPATRLSLNIPIQRVIQKLQNQGMCKVKDW